MNAGLVAQYVMNGLMLGMMYALVAVGFTLFFGVLDVIKFSHGDVLMLGAFAALATYVAAKGSIALDGVSLTVNEVEPLPGGAAAFAVNIIPHTARETGLGEVRPGDKINIEIDILARYLGRMLDARNAAM